MAFNANKGDINSALQEEFNKTTPTVHHTEGGLLEGNAERPISVGYTIQPSVKKKISALAKQYNYRSASAFVNDVFKKWEQLNLNV